MRIASNPSRNISTNDSMNRLAGEPRSATSRHARLLSGLERAERLVADRGSPANLFMESFVLMLREGFEAILIVAALMTFLAKAGAVERHRHVAQGDWAAVVARVVTAVVLDVLCR